MTVKAETLIKAYVRIRDDLDAERKAFKLIESAHKKNLDKIEVELNRMANELGVESFKTVSGTAFQKKVDFVSVKDWQQTLPFIIKHDLWHMLNKKVGKVAVKEYMSENNDALPPGVEYGQKIEVQVRRPK